MQNKRYELKVKGTRFYNFPTKLKVEEYDQTLKKVIKIFSKLKGLNSIYLWGSINNPGISDMDILLVTEDNIKKIPFRFRSVFFLEKKIRKFVYHPFVLCKASEFSNLKYIYPRTKFKKVYGKEIRTRNIDKTKIDYVKAALLSDLIVRHYPRDFVRTLFSKEVDVRASLLRLGSLKYTLKTLKEFNINLSSGKIFSEQINKLRENWFFLGKKEQKEKLIFLINMAIKIDIEIIERWDIFLKKRGIIEVSGKGGEKKYVGDKNKAVFVIGWKKEECITPTKSLSKKDREIIPSLPLSLCINLIEYSKVNGVLSDYIRKNISSESVNYQIDKTYSEVLNKRIKILNNQAELSVKTKHLHFPGFFDFGYMHNKGLFIKLFKVVRYLGSFIS